jgi:hypothetical protein
MTNVLGNSQLQDGRRARTTILKCILKKKAVRIQTVLNCFRIM